MLRAPSLRADSARLLALYSQRSDFGTTEVAFSAPLPATFGQRHYYLLDSTGVVALSPDQLAGTLRIRWSESGAIIEGMQAFGNLRAPLPRNRGGGFVMSAPTPLSLIRRPSSRSADQLLSPGGEPYPDQGTPFWAIIRQYEIREAGPGTRVWIWVQWRADAENRRAGCAHRYTLFRASPRMAAMATADDGCDV